MAPLLPFKILAGCCVFVVSISTCGLLAEYAFRVMRGFFGDPPIYQYDKMLGWSPIPDLRYDFKRETQSGGSYVAHYGTNEFGFRHWGDHDSDRPRIFFVGDSFTQDANMSNECAYFSQVARMLPVEVFAVGGGGYGTLQEALVLARYWQIVRPTHVVIQFCSNDVVNNHYDTETLSIVRSQKNQRPYLVDKRMIFRNAPFYRFLYYHSMLFRFADQRLQNFQYSRLGGYTSVDDEQQIRALHDAAVEVTREILRKTKELGTDSIKWYMFNCEAAGREWMDLAKQEGFEPIVGVAEAVEAAEVRGWSVLSSDRAHWNNLGHEIAGRVLADYFRNELSQDQHGPIAE